MYQRRELLAKAITTFILVMLITACKMDEPGESPATNSADSASLPLLVVEHFEKYFGEIESESGELLPGGEIRSESKDMDNDGKAELFLYDSSLCGSGGCTGPVYSEKSENGSYCFVAMGHSADFFDDLIVLEPLTCIDYESNKDVHLSDMKKFIRPK